jgi:hypothetical protein
MMRRRTYGHLHYFTRDLALRNLADEGYEVADWFYAPFGMDFPVGVKGRIMSYPKKEHCGSMESCSCRSTSPVPQPTSPMMRGRGYFAEASAGRTSLSKPNRPYASGEFSQDTRQSEKCSSA